jgi:hypothetical protein
MKLDATEFIDNLILQDYILFGSVFILFVLFIILAIVLRKKLGLAIFFILLSICILFLGPTVGYIQMHKYLLKILQI